MSAISNALSELASVSPTDTTEAAAEYAALLARVERLEEICKNFYEYGLGVNDTAVNAIIGRRERLEDYRSVIPFQKTLDDWIRYMKQKKTAAEETSKP